MPLVALLGTVTAQLQQITNFGSNPSGAKMFVHVPNNLPSNPAIVVAIHHCQGTAQSYYQNTPYAQLSDQKGFIVIYPESPYSGTCWDVSSKATMTHDGGANSNSIANMVRYALQTYKADPAKVFVTGTSSGAMMTVSRETHVGDGIDSGIERHGRHLSRPVCSWHRLFWCASRMLLHQLGQWLELGLRSGQSQ